MKRFCALALLCLAACPLLTRAEHARIDLRVMQRDPESGQVQKEETAAADQEPPTGGVQPRKLFEVKAGKPLLLQFHLMNTYPHGENKGVVLRYFVVRVKKVNQKELPPLDKGVVTRGQFTMNFKPKTLVGGARVQFTLPEPGIYLLRVDTANTNSDHEHFSAIDLRAK
jgi:hypothetical protein